MKTVTTKATAEAAEGTLFRGDDWFHPLGAGVRTRIRAFVEELPEAERDAAPGRDRMNGLGLPRPAFKRRIKTQTVLPPEGVERGGNRGDVVLGFASFWSEHDAQGRRPAKPQRKAFRSDD